MDGYVQGRFTVNGASLAVWRETHDTAAPILFQHGLCGDAAQTADMACAQAGHCHHVVECRGHGDSEAGAGSAFSIAKFTDDIAAYLEATFDAPVVVGGISMGAAIAQRLAVKHRHLVRALVLARPAWFLAAGPDNMKANALAGDLMAKQDNSESAFAAFQESAIGQRLAREAPGNFASISAIMQRKPFDVTAELLSRISSDGPGVGDGELAALSFPTLVIATDADIVHPIAHAEALAAAIPHAQLRVIPPKAAGYDTHKRAFRAALSTFLKEID
ncbi:MAG: alpha/beta hydrolase [Pseudomonadota bacterium]